MHENTPVTRVDVPQYTELHPQEAIEEKFRYPIVSGCGSRFIQWIKIYI